MLFANFLCSLDIYVAIKYSYSQCWFNDTEGCHKRYPGVGEAEAMELENINWWH